MYFIVMVQVFFASLYIGSKLSQIPFLAKLGYPKWVFFGVTMVIVVAGYLSSSALFGYLVYVIILYLLYDVIRFVLSKIKKRKSLLTIYQKYTLHGGIVIVVAALLTIAGYINAKNIKVTTYQVEIKKEIQGQSSMNIAMISDAHIGTAIGLKELTDIVEKINAQRPDVIFLVGDIFDESTTQTLYEESLSLFSQLESTHGTYYVIGNHEVYANNGYMAFIDGLKEIGITTLLDEVSFVDESFYVVGRLDKAVGRHNEEGKGGEQTSRKSIEQLMEGVNTSYPIIVLNHQPEDFESARTAGVDLVLSGHTHNGQIFPGNIIVSLFNELGYGEKRMGNMTAIVSSGAGTWGFPVRVGSDSEIVLIQMKW